MLKHLTTLSIIIAPLFASPTPLPLTTTILSSDYTSQGHLQVLNASTPYFPGAGPITGCITSSFTWTLDTSACGLFNGNRTVYNQSIGMWMYAFGTEEGACGLVEGGRVTCSSGGIKSQGKWSTPNSTIAGIPLYMMGWANWPIQNWPSQGVDVDVWNTLVSNPVPGVVLEGFGKSFTELEKVIKLWQELLKPDGYRLLDWDTRQNLSKDLRLGQAHGVRLLKCIDNFDLSRHEDADEAIYAELARQIKKSAKDVGIVDTRTERLFFDYAIEVENMNTKTSTSLRKNTVVMDEYAEWKLMWPKAIGEQGVMV
ncbi:hypothetical protein SBOR_5695 [Sclerotinia borealis F-4128]|uniref:Uncharacterized protein n=1 Tax=Sclerotinia borealis (strain F-4128) TaxID=1432307 RepID=W9CDJ6_SCLBF|nr:hypothetical protein SBOR_5695 [Sclerotinia borealis F-4128]